jgi:hypothetical protein
MLTGEPASKISSSYSARNINVIDYGDYYKARSGSRPYTSFKIGYAISSVSGNEVTIEGTHPWQTGDVVYVKENQSGDDLPSGLNEDVAYYAVRIDQNTLSFATTYENAFAGTRVNISTDGDGWVYWGEINAREDHDAKGVIVMMLGISVYVLNKAMNTIQKVLNLHKTDPSGESWMQRYENDVILWSSTGIFRIVLDEGFPYMFPINLPVPSVLVTDVNETETLIYGYLYFYSHTILDGSGNRSRLDSEIKFESGLNLLSGQAKDYGEIYFETEIGLVLSETHSVGTLTLPDTAIAATHFTLYRTRNIGENSGGVTSSIDGIGNRRDLVLYAADVPVAKVFLVTIVDNIATIVSGNKFVRGDVSCAIKNESSDTAEISGYLTDDTVSVTSGIDVAEGYTTAIAIGGGRVGVANQTGNVLTLVNISGAITSADVGMKIFLSDGTYLHMTGWVSMWKITVAEEREFTGLAITCKPATGNFSRKWNDTVPDDPNSSVVGSLKDLYEYGSDIYIPRRQFKPVPNCNVGIVEAGFMVAMDRDSMRYYYSQIGDKQYHMGYYRDPTQTKKLSGTVRHCIRYPFMAVVMMRRQTGVIKLDNAGNVGRTEIGENVFELPEMNVIDTERGVNLWQTITFKNSSLVFALTDDGAWRYFDGTGWSKEDLAYVGGKDAVSRGYLRKLDTATEIATSYSPYGGMKLWMTRNLPNTEPTDTVYEIVQYCDSIEAEESTQFCDSVESEEIEQMIGVVHG